MSGFNNDMKIVRVPVKGNSKRHIYPDIESAQAAAYERNNESKSRSAAGSPSKRPATLACKYEKKNHFHSLDESDSDLSTVYGNDVSGVNTSTKVWRQNITLRWNKKTTRLST